MIYIVVDAHGVITNRIILNAPENYPVPDGYSLFEETEPMDIGATYQDGVYTPLPTPPPSAIPVNPISDWQFFQKLADLGIITQAEALASNGGVIPKALLDIIDGLPEAKRFAAKMRVGGATVYNRTHWLTIAVGHAYGWTDEQIDDFFRSAAAL